MTRGRTQVETAGWTVTMAPAWRRALGTPSRVIALLGEPEAILQENDRGAVYRTTIGGQAVVLKRASTYERRRWIRLTSLVRTSEGARTFATLQHLHAAGLPVPEPVFAADRRAGGLIVESWYAYARVEGIPCTCRDTPAVATALRALHDAGWVHGDPHVANFLRDGAQIRVLDCVKARRTRSPWARGYDVVLLDKCCPGAASHYPGLRQPWYALARVYSRWLLTWRAIKRFLRHAVGVRRLPALSELRPTAAGVVREHAAPPLPMTGVVITHNEEERLGRCLASLAGLVAEMVVVDSGSTDRTRAIAEAHGARVEVHAWHGFVGQKNLAVSLASQPWVICLDADEQVSAHLATAVRAVFLRGDPSCDGFEVNRLNAYLGAWVGYTWYPEWKLRIARTAAAAWRGGDVHERLTVPGQVRRLDGFLLHEPYRNLADHLDRLVRYARLGADSLAGRGRRAHWYHLLWSPWLAFAKQILLKQGWRDGWRGWVIASSSFMKVAAKYALLFEHESRSQASKPPGVDL